MLGQLKGGAMKMGQAMSIFEAAMPEDVAGPYRAALTKLQAESVKLVAATDAAAFKAQFPPTGGSCKNCHDTFREEKKDQ